MRNTLTFKDFIFENEDKFSDYPKAASANAKKAIEWKEKYGRDEVQGGTAVGWQRAHQLAKGEAISRDVLGRMAAFNRHRKNSKVSAEHKDTPWKDNGHIAWLIWGGDEGVDWAIKKMDQLEESVKESEEHDGMAFAHLENIIDNAHGLRKRYEAGYTFDAWMHGKILKAKDYLTSVYDSLDGSDGQLESVVNEEKAKGDRGPLDNPDIEKALKSKADDTGVPIGLLRIVMRRGMDAWNSGHRPGVGQEQWGYARVNAFLEKGKGTWQNADKDVAKEVRDGGNDKKLPKKY